jgi:Protein of unknown function (DUF2934)
MRDEQRIRERAYGIWEREGRPEGRQEAHWEQARRECAQEDAPEPPRSAQPDAGAGAATNKSTGGARRGRAPANGSRDGRA